MLALQIAGLSLVALAAAGPAPHAAFTSNLAYRSPSLNVSELAIPLSSVQQRLGKRWTDTWSGNVSFPCVLVLRGRTERADTEWPRAIRTPTRSSFRLSRSHWTSTCAAECSVRLIAQGVYGNPTQYPVCVHYVVSRSATDFSRASSVADGYAQTTFDVGNSIKVEAVGLQAYTLYYYRFEVRSPTAIVLTLQACDNPALGQSIVGSFRTLPGENDDVSKIQLAVFSCSNLP